MYNVQMLKHFSIYSNAFRIKYSQCYIFFVKCGGILLLFSLHFNQICACKAGLRRLHGILEIVRRFLSL